MYNEKFGQQFIIGISDSSLSEDFLKLIKKYKIGGVILYKRNYQNYNEMIDVINKLKENNKENDVPIFIGIDQENGRVNRLPDDFHLLPSALRIADLNDEKLLDEWNDVTYYILSKSGINLNTSPNLDINKQNSD